MNYFQKIFLASVLFCANLAHSEGLEGVWQSSFGEMRITERPAQTNGTVFFWGEYARIGYVAGLRKGGVARGIFVHANLDTARPKNKPNNLGLFEWRLDDMAPGTWQGNWTWGKNRPAANSGKWNATLTSTTDRVNHSMRPKVAGYLLILLGSDGGRWINDIAKLPYAEPLGLRKAALDNRRFSSRGAPSTLPAPDFVGNSCAESDCVQTVRQGLNVLRETLWEDMPIPVCWENPLAENASGRSLTRTAVETTWARVSKVSFSDWSGCPAGNTYNGIRIRIEDSAKNPHVKALGKRLAGVKNGMSLNFTFKNWGTSCSGQETFCLQAIAVHEFGHALGFAHEHNDVNSRFVGCEDEPQGTNGDWQVTPLDLQSVMNYCNPNWNGGGALSRFDIEGVRKLYGHASNAYYAVGGVSHEGDGAGLASWDLDGNGQRELIMLAYNDAPGSNDFRYRVARDLDTSGRITAMGRFIKIGGMGNHGAGAGLTLADINGNGRPEMFVLADNAASGANSFRYKIGWDLDADGVATRWTQIPEIAGVANDGMGAGIEVADIDGNGLQDLILMSYYNDGSQTRFRYRIGFDMDANGVPTAGLTQGGSTINNSRTPWRTDQTVSGFPGAADGAGLVVRDLDKNGHLDMVLMAYVDNNGPNRFAYKILWDLDQDGNLSSQGSWANSPHTSRGHLAAGAGLDAADVDGDGNLEFLMMAYDDPNGQNDFRVTVKFDPY